MITKPTKSAEIKRGWHLINVQDQILGRIGGEIASKLMGKNKPYFTRNLDCGDYVVVVNAALVKTTGKKEEQKKYRRHSGYPHGYKEETLAKLRIRKPEDIIMHSVRGMLPQNKLRDRMLSRLFIFPDNSHPYQDKFKTV
ncbi:MAG: 50S ribosomal protein L13 [Patescibacteria group bacterium]|nr:50S ribosomal protein L13 [Patescibacteria group bacterium]